VSIIGRIRELFGGKRSGAEYGAVTAGAVVATSDDDPGRDADAQSDSSGFDLGGWGGDGGGGGGGDGGGGGGG
jgi:hypothetical protein